MSTVGPDNTSHTPKRVVRKSARTAPVPQMHPRSKDGQVTKRNLNREQGWIPDERVRSGIYGGTSGTGGS